VGRAANRVPITSFHAISEGMGKKSDGLDKSRERRIMIIRSACLVKVSWEKRPLATKRPGLSKYKKRSTTSQLLKRIGEVRGPIREKAASPTLDCSTPRCGRRWGQAKDRREPGAHSKLHQIRLKACIKCCRRFLFECLNRV